MGYTEKQQKAITSREGNLLVSASAGSGKTTVMIERVVGLLREGASLDNMVICTFTRASAAEMRDKLAQMLSSCEANGEAFAEKQLTKLSTAEISTLHSWCQRLIRAYFFELGVDPAFEILEENEASAMLTAATEEAIKERAVAPDEQFSAFYEAMRGKHNDAVLKNFVIKIYQFSEAQADPDGFLRERATYGLDNEKALLDIINGQYDRVARRCLSQIDAFIAECAECGFLKGYEHFTALRTVVKTKIGEFPSWSRGQKKGFDEINARGGKLLTKIKKEIIAALEPLSYPSAASREFTEVLVQLVCDTKRRYCEEKARRARLDYGDLEHLALRLLGSEAVQREICEKYRYVFVDEYQDINPLQESILSKLKQSTMFLVGDVKQSIYAFRMCDPGIFLDKYENYAQRGYCAPIELNDNFRSNKCILDFANLVMKGLMTEDFGRINYERDAMLVCGNKRTDGEVVLKTVVEQKRECCHSGVYSVLNEAPEQESGIEAEANLVVKDICERLASVDADGKQVRQSDIAVLSATRSELTRLIYRKLRSLGVNVSVTDKDRFASVYEVSVLCEFMKHLTDYTDDISLVAVLRSPLVGLSDGELAEIKLSGNPKENRFHVLCRRYAASHSDEIAQKLQEFFELRERYRMMSKTRTACETVGELVAEKKWFVLTFAGADGRVNADALNSFMMHLNTLPQARSVAEYVEYLKRDNADFTPPPAADAVKMMTIHSAKGLEYKYVYLVDTSHGFNFTDLSQRVVCNAELGICVKNFDLEYRRIDKSLLSAAVGILEKRKLLEERMRLLYVALTRAKEGMYVYARVGEGDAVLSGEPIETDYEKGTSFFEWLRPVAAMVRRESYLDTDCTLEGVRVKEHISLPSDGATVAAIRDYVKRGEAYERDATRVKSSVTALMEEQREEQPYPVHYSAGADDDRAIRNGNAYHKAMELIDFYADFDSEWERIQPEGEIAEFVDREKLRTAVKKVGELCKDKRIYKEKQFILSEGGRLVQGVIDLLIVEGDECTVVDYKTSRPERIESGEYALQLSVYAYAAKKILSLRVKQAAIYGFEKGEFTFSTALDENPLKNAD